MKCVRDGEAIEGERIEGSSRDPWRRYPALSRTKDGKSLHGYWVDFDVSCKVTKVLSPNTTRLNPRAYIELEDEITICEKALIESFDAKPKRPEVSSRTGRHKANFWKFNSQTSVKIVRARQEIAHQLQKTERKLDGKNKKK